MKKPSGMDGLFDKYFPRFVVCRQDSFVFFKKRVKSFVKGAFECYFVTKPNADREFKNLCVIVAQ